MNKLMSGRFILTVISGLAFGWCVVKNTLPPEATASILTAVFVSYFNKGNDVGKENTK